MREDRSLKKAPRTQKSDVKALVSWAFYDWANSAFMAVIQTFLFAAYFTDQVAADKAIGTWAWGMSMSVAAFAVAVMAPIFGAMADQTNHHRAWLAPFTLLCIVSTGGLWFVEPDPSSLPLAMALIVLATYGSEMAFVFYNAMLSSLAPRDEIGRWSAWGYCCGYLGGLVCLGVVLGGFVLPGAVWHGANREAAEHIRMSFVVVAVWYALFSLPLFLLKIQQQRRMCPLGVAFRKGIKQLLETAKQVGSHKKIVYFLIAHMLYADGLSTTFIFGGVLAAGLYQMSTEKIMIFGIALNIVAGIGSGIYALVASHMSCRKTIIVVLSALIGVISAILLSHSEWQFWILGMVLGALVGPVQAASRAYLARTAPQHLMSEMFGFFALSGKATAFVGPMLVGWLTFATGNQRLGVSVVLLFLLAGVVMVAMLTPHVEKHSR